MDNRSSKYSVIPTPSVKHVPIILLVTEKECKTNPPLSYGSSLMTENSRVHTTQSYTKKKLKDKDSIPSYEEIASRISTEVYTTIKSEEEPT